MLFSAESSKVRKRLCVVLITNDHSEGEDQRRQLMRDFVANFKFSSDRVRFVYVSRERQSDFVSSLVRGTTDLDPALNVVIVWRKDSINLKYEWLEREWQEETANASSDDLHRTLQVNFNFCGNKN